MAKGLMRVMMLIHALFHLYISPTITPMHSVHLAQPTREAACVHFCVTFLCDFLLGIVGTLVRTSVNGPKFSHPWVNWVEQNKTLPLCLTTSQTRVIGSQRQSLRVASGWKNSAGPGACVSQHVHSWCLPFQPLGSGGIFVLGMASLRCSPEHVLTTGILYSLWKMFLLHNKASPLIWMSCAITPLGWIKNKILPKDTPLTQAALRP